MSAPRIQAPPAPAGGSAAVPRPAYRPEVQGLRALAVVLVVLYHVWLGRVSGGVDIFLLISAFLLTGSFARRIEAGRALELGRYWARVFKRLLPAAALVLLGVLAAAVALLPASAWAGLFRQTWASLFYVQNWALANSSVDYYARDNSAASPLQHFWSLSVQGQVFLLWPLLFAAAALAARRFRIRPRPLMISIFGAVFALSLAFSIHETATNQAYAYFDTRTRLWEFALGSLLALLLPYLRLPLRVRVAIGWIGLAGMLSCGLLLQVQQQFPGWIALWPLLSAAMIIAAGSTGHRAGVDRLLTAGPLVRLGDHSYTLYLWHWPLLVFWLAFTGSPQAGLLDGAAIIAASLVLAVVTSRLVERPLRRWRWSEATPLRSATVAVACLSLVALPLAGWQERVRAEEQAVLLQGLQDNPGALALHPEFELAGSTEALIKPSLSSMDQEWTRFDGRCAGDLAPADPAVTSCVEIGTAEGAARTVVILGDSHAQQWASAVGAVARVNNWHVIALLKPGCRYAAPVPERKAECNAFNAGALNYTLEKAPDLVFTVASVTTKSTPEEYLAPGYEDGVRPIAEAGIPVIAMRDNPRFDFDMVKCLEENNLDTGICALPRSQVLAEASPLAHLEQAVPGVHVVDMTDQLCTPTDCPGIVGNMVVYMDHDHLGRTYLETTSQMLAARILAATGWDGSTATMPAVPEPLQMGVRE